MPSPTLLLSQRRHRFVFPAANPFSPTPLPNPICLYGTAGEVEDAGLLPRTCPVCASLPHAHPRRLRPGTNPSICTAPSPPRILSALSPPHVLSVPPQPRVLSMPPPSQSPSSISSGRRQRHRQSIPILNVTPFFLIPVSPATTRSQSYVAASHDRLLFDLTVRRVGSAHHHSTSAAATTTVVRATTVWPPSPSRTHQPHLKHVLEPTVNGNIFPSSAYLILLMFSINLLNLDAIKVSSCVYLLGRTTC